MYLRHFKFDPIMIKDFIRLGYNIYSGDPIWIPPLHSELNQQLSPQYSFYNKSGNRHRHFIIYDNGKPQGRITAMINVDLKDEDNTPVGTLGFFECKNNYIYARILFEASVAWLLKYNIRRVWGPMNFDIWHSYRFMTKGFGQNPFYGEPYNKPYYNEFFAKFGFNVKAEWDSVEIVGKDILRQMIDKGAKRYRFLVDRGYRFELINMNNYENELEKLHQVMTRSFAGFPGFTPLGIEQLKQLFKKAQYAIHPKMFLFVYNKENELAGFAVALLELADAIRAMKGSTNILSKMKFLYHRKFINKINFYIGGVIPEEIKNRSGLGRAGFYFILNEILKEGFDTMLLTLRLKGNAAHALPSRFSPEPQREYALYQVEL